MMHRACGHKGYNDGGRVRSNSMNGPVAMLFALFEASVEPQEHANQPTPNKGGQKDTWSTLQAICERAPLIRLAFIRPHPRKTVAAQRELVKSG
jgi:hypothetical protein